MDNIISIAEKVLRNMDLNYSRVDENELIVSLPPSYNLSILLKPEYEMLHFSNDLDLVCSSSKLAIIEDSIIKANERIWLGHFDLISSTNRLVYSLSLPFVYSFLFDEDTFESLINSICDESDRFYHYFKMVLSNKEIPNFSVSSLFQESVGEA